MSVITYKGDEYIQGGLVGKMVTIPAMDSCREPESMFDNNPVYYFPSNPNVDRNPIEDHVWGRPKMTLKIEYTIVYNDEIFVGVHTPEDSGHAEGYRCISLSDIVKNGGESPRALNLSTFMQFLTIEKR